MLYVSVVDVEFSRRRVNEKILDRNQLVKDWLVDYLDDSLMIMPNANVRYSLLEHYKPVVVEARVKGLRVHFLVIDVEQSVGLNMHVLELMMEQEDEINVERDYSLVDEKERRLFLRRKRMKD